MSQMTVDEFDEACLKEEGKLRVQQKTHTCVVGRVTLGVAIENDRVTRGMAGVKTTRGDAYRYLSGKLGTEYEKKKRASSTLYIWKRQGRKITLSVGDRGTNVMVQPL